MACFLYWAMFLKASGLNGVDALAMVLGNREGKLGHYEVVVEPRCLSGYWSCCSLCGAPRPVSMRGRESHLRQVGMVYVLKSKRGLFLKKKTSNVEWYVSKRRL